MLKKLLTLIVLSTLIFGTSVGLSTADQNIYALDFDGVDDYVTIPHNNNQNAGENFAVELWTKIQNPVHFQGDWLISKHESGVVSGWYAFIDPSTGQVQVAMADTSINNWRQIISPQAINDEQWHHIAFTKVGNTLSLYIDGILSGQNADFTGDCIATNKPIRIGAFDHTSGWGSFLKSELMMLFRGARLPKL